MPTYHIACDLGAESGRVMLGTIDEGRLSLAEIHRFSNGPMRFAGTLRWNIASIFEELKRGMKAIAARGIRAESVSVDSWGVDLVWFNASEPMLALPYHYRDSRTDSSFPAFCEKATRGLIFSETGIQFMPFNTLFQIADDVARRPEIVAAASGFLNIADYLNYLFCGIARSEESLASTTQIWNPKARQWSAALIAQLGLAKEKFPEVVPSGTVLGELSPGVAEETGLAETQVIATCSHDTGAAIAAVPAEGKDWAYLSSGTWSLIGLELDAPLINAATEAANITNEVGYGGSIRFLKNISGLWILQECRRQWKSEGQDFDYDTLTQLAGEAEPLRSIINPNDPAYTKPFGMVQRIAAACEKHGEPVPRTTGEFVRCILESLALTYDSMLRTLCGLTGRTVNKLHIVGGGSQSRMLNQAAADATGCTVYAGPVEATAIGNVLVQAAAMGHVDGLAGIRAIVRDSFAVEAFQPKASSAWESAKARYARIEAA